MDRSKRVGPFLMGYQLTCIKTMMYTSNQYPRRIIRLKNSNLQKLLSIGMASNGLQANT